ncbi:DUF7009 family protein [Ekhidna sp.]|uniref:DUF7009 family protein n=1 Tax=Ekhidna sp. TaxID=2608089 RepID=UPI003CCBD04F
MKLRIHQNSIRIRLSGDDSKALKESGFVREELQFDLQKTYCYQLRLAGENKVILEEGSMIVSIDRQQFLNQNHVSITWVSSEGLKVLVESDLYG